MSIIKNIVEKLQSSDPALTQENAQNQAWWLIQWVTGKTQSQLISQKEIQLTAEQKEKLNAALRDHVQEHKPLQYILGSVPFLDLTIHVRPPILIPRPETEYWCSLLIESLQKLKNKNIKILDLCTGTGCIALALARALPESQVYAVDINPNALDLACENSLLNGITNITFIESDLYSELPQGICFDLICANPPYISSSEWKALDVSVKKWEDPVALKSEFGGLELIEKIIEQSRKRLNAHTEFLAQNIPQIWVEIGYRQAESVRAILKHNGFEPISVITDLAGKDRVLTAGIPACGFLTKRKT